MDSYEKYDIPNPENKVEISQREFRDRATVKYINLPVCTQTYKSTGLSIRAIALDIYEFFTLSQNEMEFKNLIRAYQKGKFEIPTIPSIIGEVESKLCSKTGRPVLENKEGDQLRLNRYGKLDVVINFKTAYKHKQDMRVFLEDATDEVEWGLLTSAEKTRSRDWAFKLGVNFERLREWQLERFVREAIAGH